MPKVNIAGVNIYYEVHGQGEPLVLVHHGTGSTKMWEHLLPGFVDKYKVILYDRKGFGRSDKEDFRNYYKSDQYTTNSVSELSALLEYLEIKDKVYILGQCEGGVIVFSFAAQYPDMVKAAAISSTMCCSNAETHRPSRPLFTTDSNKPPSFENASPAYRDILIRWQGEAYAPELFTLFVEGGGAYAVGPGPFDLRNTCKNVQCPALVLYPDRSTYWDVEQGVLMYHSLPQGELAVIPKSGQSFWWTHPEEYLRIVLAFFARHP
jgi:pimeloyl-ACP methyl ester carboxylesterase